MGGLIEVGGIEVNAIDALLYVWFVLAGLISSPHHQRQHRVRRCWRCPLITSKKGLYPRRRRSLCSQPHPRL